MNNCKVYTLGVSPCPCILILIDPQGREKRFNLWGATSYPTSDGSGFVIKDFHTSATISPLSLFTQADIDILICTCQS